MCVLCFFEREKESLSVCERESRCVSLSVCGSVFLVERERERERKREREIEGEREKEREREREREKGRVHILFLLNMPQYYSHS